MNKNKIRILHSPYGHRYRFRNTILHYWIIGPEFNDTSVNIFIKNNFFGENSKHKVIII